jgi:hypothetical protein
MNNLKDKVTNYLAILLVALGALNGFLQTNAGKPIDWVQLVLFVSLATISFVIGKSPNLLTKTSEQVTSENAKTGTVVKALALLIGLSLICNFSQAQNPFKGFFKPVTIESQSQRKSAISITDVAITPNWLFRPTWSINALKLQSDGKQTFSSEFTSPAIGISYQEFTTVNEKPYCQFAVNGLVLFNIDKTTQSPINLGAAVTVGVFNNIISVGAGYDFNPPAPLKGLFALLNISYPLN